jgi:hypothetical protein
MFNCRSFLRIGGICIDEDPFKQLYLSDVTTFGANKVHFGRGLLFFQEKIQRLTEYDIASFLWLYKQIH